MSVSSRDSAPSSFGADLPGTATADRTCRKLRVGMVTSLPSHEAWGGVTTAARGAGDIPTVAGGAEGVTTVARDAGDVPGPELGRGPVVRLRGNGPALLSDSSYAMGTESGSFDGIDLYIVLCLARASGVGGSDVPCNGPTADAANLMVQRVLEVDPQQAAPSLALAAHLGPWTRVYPVDFVASAVSHGLRHLGEGIYASTDQDVPHQVSRAETLTLAFAQLEGADPEITYGFVMEWADLEGVAGSGAGTSLL